MRRRAIGSARIWLLILLDAAERVGVAPLSVERLHRLVYLANAMAPVYDLLTPDGYVLKFKRGPFFPAVQWDIDRLSVQGLASVSGTRRRKDDLGWWFEANYSLSKAGMTAVDGAMKLEAVGQKAAFLREVVRAFSTLLDEEQRAEGEADSIMLTDVSFENADAEAPIDFRTASENLTVLAAGAIAARVVQSEALSRRAKVHLYFQYLDRVWDRRRGAAVG